MSNYSSRVTTATYSPPWPHIIVATNRRSDYSERMIELGCGCWRFCPPDWPLPFHCLHEPTIDELHAVNSIGLYFDYLAVALAEQRQAWYRDNSMTQCCDARQRIHRTGDGGALGVCEACRSLVDEWGRETT